MVQEDSKRTEGNTRTRARTNSLPVISAGMPGGASLSFRPHTNPRRRCSRRLPPRHPDWHPLSQHRHRCHPTPPPQQRHLPPPLCPCRCLKRPSNQLAVAGMAPVRCAAAPEPLRTRFYATPTPSCHHLIEGGLGRCVYEGFCHVLFGAMLGPCRPMGEIFVPP